MQINPVQFIIALPFIIGGLVFMCVETFGIFRVHYVLNRMHAAAMGDTLGIGLITVGFVIIFGFSFATLKVILILALFWMASPVCSHLLAKLETMTNDYLEDDCEVDEL